MVFEPCGPGNTCGAERMAARTTEALASIGYDMTVVETAGQWPSTPPDLVHGYDLARPKAVSLAYQWSTHLGVPFVLTPASTPEVWPDLDLGRSLCQAADAVFTLTSQEGETMRRLGVPPDRIKPIPLAPDLVGTAQPDRFRRTYGIQGDMVLFLGRRLVTKGYLTLLDAADEVWLRCPDITFVFAGPGDAAPLPRHPQVRDLGMVDDQTKHDAIAASTLVCLPTSADVFPLVFVEAWHCGKPVISGDYPGVHDVVRHGTDGLVVTPAPAPIAEAIISLLADPGLRDRMGTAGHQRARSGMNWTVAAEETAAVYREFAGKGGGRVQH